MKKRACSAFSLLVSALAPFCKKNRGMPILVVALIGGVLLPNARAFGAAADPVGLSLFFQNGSMPPIALVGNVPRYLQEIDIIATVTTQRTRVLRRLFNPRNSPRSIGRGSLKSKKIGGLSATAPLPASASTAAQRGWNTTATSWSFLPTAQVIRWGSR
jgi:hypothetical protein